LKKPPPYDIISIVNEREKSKGEKLMYTVYDKETNRYHECFDGVELKLFLDEYIPSKTSAFRLWLDNLDSRIREGQSPSAHFTERFYITYSSKSN
jgi:hypothetical protein